MTANTTLLCIHRKPTQLNLLQENGYELVTATNGHDGLRIFMSRPVDAIVLEYQLSLQDGSVVAAEIKRTKPRIPIVMLAEDAELPNDALKSVDALVTKSDGAHFLLATLHFVLSVKPAQRQGEKLGAPTPVHLRRPGRSWGRAGRWSANTPQLAVDDKAAPFPQECGEASGMGSFDSDWTAHVKTRHRPR
jgi:DNA-binding response OmpR family regulator